MKQYLFTLLVACSFTVQAQQPPGAPATKTISMWGQQQLDTPVMRDMNFVFDKHYYDMENHWVVFPKRPGYAHLKGMYAFGFIYFDAQTGYTFINEGLFDINAQGHAYRDSSISPRSVKGPIKSQLGAYTGLLAAIPDNVLNDLKVKKVPDWLPAYRRNNPDTNATLAKKITYGHVYQIYARDAAMHIGEYAEVEGMLYGGVVKPDPAKPGSKMALLYLGGGSYPDQKITIVIKDISDKGQTWVEAMKTSPKPKDKLLSENNIFSAEGKIFLLDGKPAVEIKYDNLGMLSWFDHLPTQSELINYQ